MIFNFFFPLADFIKHLKWHHRGRAFQKAVSSAMLKSGFPVKGTKDIPVTALCDGRGRTRERNVGPHLLPLQRHWQNRSCSPSLCRGHAVGFVQEGQRHLKSLTEGGFGCLVTPRTVQNFFYRKKNIILWAKKKKKKHNI